jgi:UDP-glucose 4-epimerase
LLDRGHSVSVLDDLSVGEPTDLPRDPRVRLTVGSVLDVRAVRAAAADCGLVVHLAGLVGMELVTRRAHATYHVSVEGTRIVLEETRDSKVVLVSSSCVYGHGPTGDGAITRDVPMAYDGGIPGYATGKWELEAQAREASARGRRVLVVRPFNVVGPRQRIRHGMVLPRFVWAALRGEPLVVYGDGMQRRAFSFVDDFVAALARFAHLDHIDRPLDLGAPTSTSILDLARTVLEVIGSDSTIVHEPYARRFPGRVDVAARAPDPARAEDLLGPLAWTAVPEIVRACVQAKVDE